MGTGLGAMDTGVTAGGSVGVVKTSGVREGVGLRKGKGGRVGVAFPLKSRPQLANINSSNVDSQAARRLFTISRPIN